LIAEAGKMLSKAVQEYNICAHAKEEYNKTWSNHNDWSRWFAILVSLLLIWDNRMSIIFSQFFGWGCRRKSK
jgi:hypothetical protein